MWNYRVVRNDDGATAIEYALIAALMFLVIVAAVRVLGSDVQALFTSVGDALAK